MLEEKGVREGKAEAVSVGTKTLDWADMRFISLEDSREVREVKGWLEFLLDFNRRLLCCSAVDLQVSQVRPSSQRRELGHREAVCSLEVPPGAENGPEGPSALVGSWSSQATLPRVAANTFGSPSKALDEVWAPPWDNASRSAELFR